MNAGVLIDSNWVISHSLLAGPPYVYLSNPISKQTQKECSLPNAFDTIVTFICLCNLMRLQVLWSHIIIVVIIMWTSEKPSEKNNS